MKQLISFMVLGFLALSFVGADTVDPVQAAPGDPSSLATPQVPMIDWVVTRSKEAAHKVEPSNPIPKPMADELAKVFVATSSDKHLLSLLTVYAFTEGAYSLDPSEPGDCKDENGISLPAGTLKCTKRLIEANRPCCSPEKAQHWCTLQVEPRPKTLEECVKRAAEIMQKDIEHTCVAAGGTDTSSSCCSTPGSFYATGGSCISSRRLAWRARIAKHLEEMP